jgi:hypothetical protein
MLPGAMPPCFVLLLYLHAYTLIWSHPVRQLICQAEFVLCHSQDKGQLLENVFADPKGFGIAPDGRYRYELPGFSAGTAQVS